MAEFEKEQVSTRRNGYGNGNRIWLANSSWLVKRRESEGPNLFVQFRAENTSRLLT